MQDMRNDWSRSLSDGEYHVIAAMAVRVQRDAFVHQYGKVMIKNDPALTLQYQEFEDQILQHLQASSVSQHAISFRMIASTQRDNHLVFGRF